MGHRETKLRWRIAFISSLRQSLAISFFFSHSNWEKGQDDIKWRRGRERKLEHYYMDITEKGEENYVYGSAHSTERRSHICQTSFTLSLSRRERERERERDINEGCYCSFFPLISPKVWVNFSFSFPAFPYMKNLSCLFILLYPQISKRKEIHFNFIWFEESN